MKSCFALVDCNNFYASCETVFRPDLKNLPIIVLSNNDGCVVARSPQAKSLGIQMGQPVFQIQELIHKNNVAVFSSNFPLYADISSRIMQILDTLSPRVEVYSIDEAFIDLSGSNENQLKDFAHTVKEEIYRSTGITTCIGIAPSKTLAKLANYAAKKYPATKGVVVLTNKERQQKLMRITPIREIWGIGQQLEKRLQSMGLLTAFDLTVASPTLLRKKGSVTLERTVRELNGNNCLTFEEFPSIKKQMVCSRSFMPRISTFNALRGAICEYTARTAERLRSQKQQAKQITVFIRTNPFLKTRYYANSASTSLATATDDTRILLNEVIRLLKTIWKPHYHYSKAGVLLTDFYHKHHQQIDIFAQGDQRKSSTLMAVIDEINATKGRIFLACQNGSLYKKELSLRSPSYTTCWNALPIVR